jgi:hypothetical protein
MLELEKVLEKVVLPSRNNFNKRYIYGEKSKCWQG